ncbi:unnamed protein product [Cylicostephanus goldi]|uniref:Major facilitator superfamily (MFS) profile domain-containing protein n=1 Tax=Cylicostephanus goldi TaxID=71465 RepID=A0A3P6QW82_CYLGO|nr:unnamed protein product [Cylicostephanus goldi]
MPLVAGRVIAFIGCCLYLCVEFLPTGRRYLMLACYFLFGVAISSSTVLRAYIAAVSSPDDRARAYSAFVVASMLSVVVGPVCQLAFSNMPYPGYVIIENALKFHIYSAPIWVASLTNFVSIAIIIYGLKDVHVAEKLEKKSVNELSIKVLKEKIKAVTSMNLPWGLIFLCWLEKMIAQLSIVTLST